MSDEIQVFLQFCEDFRVEEGGKPMLIGLLSPVFYLTPEPGEADELQLITLIMGAPTVNSVELKLEVTISTPAEEDKKTRHRAVLSTEDRSLKEEPWSAWLPHPVSIPEWKDGMVVKAEVHVEGVSAHTQVRCLEDKPSPAPKPTRKTADQSVQRRRRSPNKGGDRK